MRKSLIITLLITSCIFLISSCSGKRKISKAQSAFEIGEYTQAAEYYKQAYSSEKNKYNKGEYAFFMGECYRITNKPSRAAMAYSNAKRFNYSNRETQLFLAEAYREMGRYDRAIPEYEEYLEEVPADLRAQKGLASCMMMQKKPKESRYQIEKIKKLNSTRYSDYSPAYANSSYDYVIFSSMRTETKKRRKNKITGQGISALYFSKINAKGEWDEPQAFEEPINNPEFDDGATNISADGKTMYFTRCRFDKDRPIGSEIVFCSRSGGKWSEPTTVTIADDSLVVAHPAISPDGNTLYFVSDREGGYGGKDIWKTSKTEKGWSEPENLGSTINTRGDEMFPYVRENNVLYFSSDTHIGLGGLDVFKATPTATNDWTVTNMGAPINSISDDFGIAFKGKKEEGMFTSSRDNARGIDNLFSFVLPQLEFTLNGNIRNKNNEVVAESYLRLIGSDGTTTKINTATDGIFKVELKPDTDYVFLVAANGYLNHKVKFTTVGETDDKDFSFDVVLQKADDIEQ